MKKKLAYFIFAALFWVLFVGNKSAYALDFYDYVRLGITPIPCSENVEITCPETITSIDSADPSDPSGFQIFYQDWCAQRDSNSRPLSS